MTSSPVVTLATVAAQPTVIGREIHRLWIWQGRLYVAYGDYGADTGPIHVVSVDLTDFTVRDEATLQTEETWTFRESLGKLYVPFIDPQSGPPDGTEGQYAAATEPGAWTVVRSVTPVPVHVFDMVETVDGIFMFGASYDDTGTMGGPSVWRSTDGGATWHLSLAPRPYSDDNARFYGAVVFGDVIYTMASSTGQTWKWAGGVWTETDPFTTSVFLSTREISDVADFTYQGTPYCFVLYRGKPESRVMLSTHTVITVDRDAALEAAILAALPTIYDFHDVKRGDTSLWLLTDEQIVIRAETNGTWVAIGQVTDPAVRCIAPDEAGGYLYFGTADSRIIRCPIPV